MKKILMLFILILVIKISSYCQETYPKEVVINNDTVICITEDQLKEVNVIFEENRAYRTIIDSTTTIISKVNGNILSQKENVQNYVNLTILLKEQINTTNNKVDNAEKSIKLLQEELKQQKKKTVKIAIGSSVISFSIFSFLYFLTK